MKNVVTSEERQALRKFACLTVSYAAQCVALLAAVYACLHAYNLYPLFRARMVQRQADGLRVWTTLCASGISEHVDCAGAHDSSELNPTWAALEAVCLHLLQDANVLSYLVPHPSSPMGYVLLKTVDYLLSYTVLLVVAGVACFLWFQWSFYAGPYRAYHAYSQKTQWSKSPLDLGYSVVVPDHIPEEQVQSGYKAKHV